MWSARVSLRELERSASWSLDRHRPQPGSESRFERCRIGELAREVRRSVEPAGAPERNEHYVGLENVAQDTGELVGRDPGATRIPRSRCKAFEPGDVLYGRLRPYLNKVYLEPADGRPGLCSPEFLVLRPRLARVDAGFLRAILASRYVLDPICGHQSGTTLPRVSAPDLLALEVPLPPLADQRRFSEFLAAGRARVRALRERALALQRELDAELLLAIEQTRLPGVEWSSTPPLSYDGPSSDDLPTPSD